MMHSQDVRAVAKGRGLGIFPSYYKYDPKDSIFIGIKRKLRLKELPDCLVPHLIAHTRHVEILATAL